MNRMFLIYCFFSVYIEVLLSIYLFKNLSSKSLSKKFFFKMAGLSVLSLIFQYKLKDTPMESLVNLMTFLVINGYISKSFNISSKKAFIYISAYLSISVLSESLVFYVLDTLFSFDNTTVIFLLVGTFLTSIFKVIFIMITISRNENKKRNDIELPNNIFRSLLIIPFLSSFILVSILYLDYYYVHFSRAIVFSILIAIFLLNISVFVIFNGIRKYYSEYVQAIQTLNTIENKLSHYNELETSMQNVRLIKHDLKNSMTTVLGLLRIGQVRKAITYLNILLDNTENSNLVFYTKNEVLNYLLNKKIDFAKENKIKVVTHILIPEKLELGNDILSVILGNIIDNAINACIEIEDKSQKNIDIKIKVFQEKLIIVVENTYDKHKQKSTKTVSNGLGLLSVKKLVNEKKGIYTVNLTENIYSVSILLFNIM